jgi:hypothetical protein
MGFIAAADPASKTAYVFTEVAQLHDAIKMYGFIPLDANGAQMRVQEFEGGYLLNGAPINVWMGQGWYSGQQEALRPYWQSGQVPTPPQDVLTAAVYEMPADVAKNYQQFKASRSLFGGSTGLIVAVVAAGAALLWLSGGKSKASGSGEESYV